MKSLFENDGSVLKHIFCSTINIFLHLQGQSAWDMGRLPFGFDLNGFVGEQEKQKAKLNTIPSTLLFNENRI